MTEPRTNLLGLDRTALLGLFARMGEKSYRAEQVLKWLYHRQVTDFKEMTDLSKDLRQRLAAETVIRLPQVKRDQIALDGTSKWLLAFEDGNAIETVFIPDGERRTLCVSSQVGCALNCTFCATARQGFNRNLTTAEIVGQVLLAFNHLSENYGERPLTNVVLMGMGEPLLNYDNVVSAMRLMLDDCSFGLSRRRVTLSTAGVVPAIDQLNQDCPVSLAVSLHAPNDELRNQLVPLNKKYPLQPLLAACKRYAQSEARRKVTFEYTMMQGVNDSLEHARQLAKILRGIPAKVNLIPFNVFPGSEFQSSPQSTLDAFREILVKAGIITITRKTRGDDIDAACGQLAGQFQDRTKRSLRWQVGSPTTH